jgi:hypothetical protein
MNLCNPDHTQTAARVLFDTIMLFIKSPGIGYECPFKMMRITSYLRNTEITG